MTRPLRELTAQFWAAAQYTRHAAPDARQHPTAQRIIRRTALIATGPLQQRALELTRNHDDQPITYDL